MPTKEEKAYEFLKELWSVPMSEESFQNIPAELSDDITALLNGEMEKAGEVTGHKPSDKIIIEVDGGIANVRENPFNVPVDIWDFDVDSSDPVYINGKTAEGIPCHKELHGTEVAMCIEHNVCPVCLSDEIKKDKDHPDTMKNCCKCGSEWNKMEVTLDARSKA